MPKRDNIIYLTILRVLFYLKADNSKGHGVHSPFVYGFIKELLNDNSIYDAYQDIERKGGAVMKGKKIHRFLWRAVKYFQPSDIMLNCKEQSPAHEYVCAASQLQRLIDFDININNYNGLLILCRPLPLAVINNFLLTANAMTVVIVLAKHTNQENRDNWRDLKQHAAVTLSIDLFEVGLLFFRKEHHQRQDFLIRF